VTTTTGQEAGPPRSPGSGDVSATAPARPGLISAGAPAPPSGMLRTGPAGTGLTGAGMLRSGGGANQQQRRRIGEVLVEQGVIDEVQLQDLLGEQARFGDPKKRPRLGRLVVDKGLATERQVAQALATALGLPLIDIGRSQVPTDVARLIPKAVCERHGVLVIAREGTLLTVAMSDPTNIVALDDIRLYTRTTDISVVVAADSDLRQQIGRMWSRTEDSEEIVSSLEYEAVVDDSDLENGADGEQAPIVRLVDVMLADAVHQRASDVHVEPQYGEVRVRFRVDGLLRDVMTVPKSAAPAIISRLKIISGLDIAERRRPQDGRARLVIDGQALDARVSTLPSLYGEKVVIRLLARAGDLKSLKDIGMEDEQLEELLLALNQPQGLILITGPTGSGKTSTLYAGINQIRTPDRNIVTLEDPVEIAVPGVIQVQINVKAGMTFSAGLRSVLRQDPDVVLVGEIRDRETAGLALEASMTGHLVLSTLHTNDAIAAVTRLIDIGVEPYLVGSSLSLVIGQRLVRRPCEDCAQSYVPSPRTMQLLGLTERDMEEGTPRRGKGCGRCGGTGYLGRVGVYEVLPITASLREVLLAHPEERALAAAARAAGYVNMRASALKKAMRGETTFEEVLRVTTADTHEGTNRCTGCGLRLADDMVCCPRCGTEADRGQCRSCGKGLDADWRVCPYCRTEKPDLDFGARDDHPPVGAGHATLPRILVVDEDPSVRGFLQTALTDRCLVDGAVSGDEALRTLALAEYDGVVLDLALPDLPGVEMVRLLREDPRTATVPLLLFTAHGDAKTEMEARTAGADDWLTKPADPAELTRRLLALVGVTP